MNRGDLGYCRRAWRLCETPSHRRHSIRRTLDVTISILVCLVTTTRRDAPFYRFRIEPTAENGLREPSDVMVDKIFALSRPNVAG